MICFARLALAMCNAGGDEVPGRPRPLLLGGRSSVGRAPGCGPGSRGFKSPRPPACERAGASCQPSWRLAPARLAHCRNRLVWLLAGASSSIWQSNGLLIRRFWVRVPGGAPGPPDPVVGSRGGPSPPQGELGGPRSSVGQSSCLLSRRSQVQVLAGAR